MPPKPGAKQIRKPAPRKRKPSAVNLQLAVGQGIDYTAAAVNAGAASAMPPPFFAPVPSSSSAPISDAPTAQEYVDLYTTLPPSSSQSTSSVLPSPSLTDEASPVSAHGPAEPYEQATAAPTETAMVLSSTHEGTGAYQTTGSQNGAVQRRAQEWNQPTQAPLPLHAALFWAMGVIRSRLNTIKKGRCPASDADRSRYSLLLSACHELDPIFLILHQQCSCWKLDRKRAYAALVPMPPELIDIAFSELCNVFGDDRQVTDLHLQWFSAFPRFDTVVGLDRVRIQAKDFIVAFAVNWPNMRNHLLSQMIPPMAYQIRDDLKCASNTISGAIFTRIRRAIGVPDGPLCIKINNLFKMDNRQELAFEEQSVPQEEMDRVRSTMLVTYRVIVQEAQREAHPPGAVMSAAPAVDMNPFHAMPPLASSNHANTNINTNTNTNIHQLAAPPQQQPPSQGPPQSQAPQTMNHQPHAAPPQPIGAHQQPQHLENPQPAVHPPPQPAASFQNQPQPQPQLPPQPPFAPRPQPQPQPQLSPQFQHQPQDQFPPRPQHQQPQDQQPQDQQPQPQHQQPQPQHQPPLPPRPQQQHPPQHQHPPQPQPGPEPQHRIQSQSQHQPQRRPLPLPLPLPQPQPQHQPRLQPQQSGLGYPTGVIHGQQPSHPLMAPRPPGQPVPEHSNRLPPILTRQNDTESSPPTAMPQRQPNHSYDPPPPPHHQGYPNQYQQQHQQQYQDPRDPPLSHGHNQNLDARPMQHPVQTTQAPLPPPWPREQQPQTQGGGSRQYQTPPPLPSNGPLQHPFHSHHHHHMPPTQTAQATQLPSTSQILQAPWTPQPHQGSRAAQLQMAPQPFLTPQHHQVHQATAQMLQASGMPYVQPQMHPQSQHSPSTWSLASTRSQTHPHFTTHPLSSNEYPSSQHDWTSVRAGLHLTHLRSPRRCPSSRHQSPSAERTRYYQFFSKFILEPTEIRPFMGVTTLEFNISREDLDSLSLTTPSSESTGDEPIYEVPVSRHFNNSHRYRIRLCESRRQEGQPTFDPAEWSRTPTYWPPHFFFTFNDESIHVRRKQHFHHDLPIELTDSLVEGKNTIKVNLPFFAQNLKENIAYFMAVELVTTLNHKSVRDLVISQPHITVEATKTEIGRRLQKLETDEITIESDTLILSVTDIISSDKLVDIPVRGRECRHLECIDLQSWLDTRPSKWWQDEGEPSMVDSWACPICGMDARPCSLAVDDFFVEIRDKILESRKSNIKNIEMRADGTWSPIEEPDDDVGSSDRDGAQQR